MMAYESIIFDLGDTLIYQHPSQIQEYIEILKRMEIAVSHNKEIEMKLAIDEAANNQLAAEEINAVPRMSDNDFDLMTAIAALKCVCPTLCESDIHKFQSYMNKLQGKSKRTYEIAPDAVEVLSQIKQKGYRLAVVSNHEKWMLDFLCKVGLSKFFESIIISSIVGFEKPQRQIMDCVLSEMNSAPHHCLYVGDHPFDVLCAKRVGMDVAWLTQPKSKLPKQIPYKEDYRISNLKALLDIL